MKVKVTSNAFYEDTRWYKGDTLEVPEGFKASWADPVEEAPEPKKKVSRKKKTTTKTNGGSEVAPDSGGDD